MRQAVLEGPGRLSVRTAATPSPRPGEVLVEVAACGICGSDVHSYTGDHPFVLYPVVPGHEFSGTVRAVGDSVPEELVGLSVCVEPSLYCGSCPQCMSGRYNICANLKVLGFQADGAMCEFITVPRDRLHALPPGVDLAAGTLAEPAAVAVHALGRSEAAPGDLVLVVGAGVIGRMTIRAAVASGCRVACVETNAARAGGAALAGANPVLTGEDASPAGIAVAAGGEIAVTIECVGSPEALDLCLAAAPRGSTVVIAGVFPGAVPVRVPLVQDGELTLKGTLMYTAVDFRAALGLLERGDIDPSSFITHEFGLDQIEDAYRTVLDPREPTMKVLVRLKGPS